MPYRLKVGESVPEGIQRIVIEELDSATQQLSQNQHKNRDEAIHEARKSVKKIRGVLRLVRFELGSTYRKENRRLRDIGRTLSELRDTAAIIETFDSVVERHKGSLQPKALSAIRQGLNKSKQEIEQDLEVEKVIKRATTILDSTKKRVRTWRLNGDGFGLIAPGLKATFRRGRTIMATAHKDPAPENYHGWRKRVKDLWYQVRLLESLWTDVMQAHEASLKDLETWLGDDHNLVVLRERLESNSEAYGNKEDIALFLTLADEYQKELREKSMSLGQRIYEEKPRQFTKNISKLWDAWQHQPDSMSDDQKDEKQGARKGAQSSSSPPSGKSKKTAA